MEEKNSVFVVVITLLVIVGAVFVYLNYNKRYTNEKKENPISKSVPSSGGKVSLSTVKGDIAVAPEGPTAQEMQQFSDRIRAIAIDTSEIIIKECQAKPSIIHVKKDIIISFRSESSTENIITFNTKQFKLPALGIEKIAASALGLGIYGFSCTPSGSAITGFILIDE